MAIFSTSSNTILQRGIETSNSATIELLPKITFSSLLLGWSFPEWLELKRQQLIEEFKTRIDSYRRALFNKKIKLSELSQRSVIFAVYDHKIKARKRDWKGRQNIIH